MITKENIIYCTLLFVALIAFQCKNTHSLSSQKAMYKSIYINQFRLTYFKQMLAKAYNNSNAVTTIITNDHSGFAESVLTIADDALIDSLTTMDNDKMKIDSTQAHLRAEGAQGKRPLGFILDKISGKWLDSLANERYKHSDVKENFHD